MSADLGELGHDYGMPGQDAHRVSLPNIKQGMSPQFERSLQNAKVWNRERMIADVVPIYEGSVESTKFDGSSSVQAESHKQFLSQSSKPTH